MADRRGTPLRVRLEGETKGFRKAMRRAADDTDKQSRRMSKAVKGVGLAVAALAAGAAVLAGAALRAFASYERKILEIGTLLKEVSTEVLQEIGDAGTRIAIATGQAAEKVASAIYDAISAGVPTDNVFAFVEEAARLAVAGNTEVAVATDLLTSAFNAFKIVPAQIGKASDIFFATVRAGKTTIDELGQSFFNIGPIAGTLGLKLEGVSAWLARLTLAGTPTKIATTQIRAALAELAKPTTVVAQLFQRTAGKSFPEFIKQGGKLKGAIDLLGKSAAAEGKSFLELFGSIEGAQAVLGITGRDFEGFTDTLQELESATGSTDEAFNIMTTGLDFQLAQLRETWDAFLREIGELLVPLALAILPLLIEALTGVKQWFDENGPAVTEWFNNLFAVVVAVAEEVASWVQEMSTNTPVVVAFGAAVGFLAGHLLFLSVKALWAGISSGFIAMARGIKLVGLALLTGPGALIAVLGLLIGALIALYLTNEDFRKFVDEAWEAVKQKFAEVWAVVSPILENFWKWLGENLPKAMEWLGNAWTEHVVPFLTAFWEWVQEAWTNTIQPALEGLWMWLGENIPKAMEWLGDAWTEHVVPFLTAFWEWVIGPWTGTIQPAVEAVAKWLGENIPKAMEELTKIYDEKLAPTLAAFLTWVNDAWTKFVEPALVAMASWLGDKIPVALTTFETFFKNVFEAIKRVVFPIINSITRKIQGIQNKIRDVKNAAKGLVDNAITQGLGAAASAVASVVPGFQHGAIVTQPTLAVVGEGGQPEGVFPLSDIGKFLGGAGGPLVAFYGPVYGDRESLGNTVIDALENWQRNNGSIFDRFGDR